MQKKNFKLWIILLSNERSIETLEDGEDKLKEEIVDLKSEVARLSGVEELLNDRISYLEGEKIVICKRNS